MRLSIFPLAGAILLPRTQLPLHVFEMRYRSLVKDSMARDRRIAMVQPRGHGPRPALFDVGCVGRIAEVEAMEDGRFNLILEGLTRFRIVREIDVDTAFRQVEAETEEFGDAIEPEPMAFVLRGSLEDESRIFADLLGYKVDWDSIAKLDDETLVNAIAQIAPFDVAAKQALIEAPGLADRAEQIIQFMRFFRMHQLGGGEDRATLQ